LTEIVNAEPIIGVTHLLVDGKLSPLYRCPICKKFRNIYINEIEHHIEFTHPGKSYNVSDFYQKVHSTSPYGPYISKEELECYWIKCLWCNYKDKIEFDLSFHFLEEHKTELMTIPITRRERLAAKALIKDPCARFFAKFESPMEYRLDKAVRMAKERGKGDIRNAG
jgi:hypothetical protein